MLLALVLLLLFLLPLYKVRYVASGVRIQSSKNVLKLKHSYPEAHLEGRGDVVNRFISSTNHVVTLIIPMAPMIHLFTKSP